MDPTEDTLSLYITFCALYVRPGTIRSYLSGICACLEADFPYIRCTRVSPLVLRMLTGVKRVHGTTVRCSTPLTTSDLLLVVCASFWERDYDSVLFVTLLLVGFDQLLRLSELCVPDSGRYWDSHRLMLCCRVVPSSDSFALHLPRHKADRFFAGSELPG